MGSASFHLDESRILYILRKLGFKVFEFPEQDSCNFLWEKLVHLSLVGYDIP
jgi:hypothetical protein